jgi:hypothetical protein
MILLARALLLDGAPPAYLRCPYVPTLLANPGIFMMRQEDQRVMLRPMIKRQRDKIPFSARSELKS